MSRQYHKRAFILHEAMMAVGLAMLLAVGVTQLVVAVAQQRRLARQYAIATREAGNLLEHIAARPWESTTSEDLASVTLPEACVQHLPDASLSIEAMEEDSATRRITIVIRWQNTLETAPDSVRLVGWKFLTREDES